MPRPGAKAHGQIRLSQVVSTFGPGSMVDLPNYSVLVAGLDHWSKGGEEIHEPRLAEKLSHLLGVSKLRLMTPPPENKDPSVPPTGITAWQFPEWFVSQVVQSGSGPRTERSRYLVHREALHRGKFVDPDDRKHPVVPIRFVRACRRGHIADLDWYAFVHSGSTPCRRQLWVDERGTSGDLSEVFIRCECRAERPMSEAATLANNPLGQCGGRQPWLGPRISEACSEWSRLLIRTASNAYFPQVMTVISLPHHMEDLARAVSQVWEHHLQYVDDLDQLKSDRQRKPPVREALEGFSDEEVLAEILARKGMRPPVEKTVKQAELETLLRSADEIGNDKPEGNFYARAMRRENWDAPWMAAVDRIVLVHRLRAVSAQVGFTRFEAAAPDTDGELEMGVTRAPLARDVSWLPAMEIKGEGIFIAFKTQAIRAWVKRESVQRRGKQLLAGFDAWKREHHDSRREFPRLEYVLLHSLSHLVITSLALECGYPASSIRERIYVGDPGCGILLYTGSPDAEGTLGGLVDAGRHMAQHVKSALELGELCSNDPVCAEHAPDEIHEHRFLHGAACHGCLLIAETSCEHHNDFLDRALVVPTVAGGGAAFFATRVG